jgi:hypothetical protein
MIGSTYLKTVLPKPTIDIHQMTTTEENKP